MSHRIISLHNQINNFSINASNARIHLHNSIPSFANIAAKLRNWATFDPAAVGIK